MNEIILPFLHIIPPLSPSFRSPQACGKRAYEPASRLLARRRGRFATQAPESEPTSLQSNCERVYEPAESEPASRLFARRGTALVVDEGTLFTLHSSLFPIRYSLFFSSRYPSLRSGMTRREAKRHRASLQAILTTAPKCDKIAKKASVSTQDRKEEII